jgi:hypothetical protein
MEAQRNFRLVEQYRMSALSAKKIRTRSRDILSSHLNYRSGNDFH